MKKISCYWAGFLAAVMAPMCANAAGTYYTGGYQSPQTRYSQQSYSQRINQGVQQGVSAYNRNQYARAGYMPAQQQNVDDKHSKTKQEKNARSIEQGFVIGAGLSRQTAMWQFEMKNSGSILHYDNIDWNVFDLNALYNFKAGNVPMQVAAGFKYGMQAGESTMVDDDITNGGYFVTDWWEDDNGDLKYLGDQIGHTLSIGTSKKGSMMEFNGGIGLKDFFKWGKLKVTPSVGWRYLKYELETHANHGI